MFEDKLEKMESKGKKVNENGRQDLETQHFRSRDGRTDKAVFRPNLDFYIS